MSTITELGVLPLAGTKNGKISISNVTEPYGKDIQWKSHIPYENLEDVIAILQKALEAKK